MSWRGVVSALRIRVALLRIGDIPEEDWVWYVRLLEEHAVIDTAELKGTAGTSVFAKQCGATGMAYFEFVQDVMGDLSDFASFQLHRRIYAAVGLGRADIRPEDREAFERGPAAAADQVKIRRCVLFGAGRPEEPQGADVVILPVEDEAALRGHVKTVMQELATAIFRGFEVLLEELSKKPVIESPRGLDAKLGKDHRLKLWAPSRLAKLTGDLYLMAGAYSSAVNVLVSATEDTKVHSDLAWHAAAQEALQLALVLQSEATLIGKEVSAVLWIALPDKLREVAPLYQKTELSILAFEVHRAVAALLDHAGSPSEAAMALCHGWAVHRQLVLPDKLYALTVIIEKFEALQMTRKRAFFLMLLSNLLAANREDNMALAVLAKTFKVYGVDLDAAPAVAGVAASPSRWRSLRRAVVQKALALSESHRDRRLMVEYGCALLAYADRPENEEQLRISQALKRRLRDSVVVAGPVPCLLPVLDALAFDADGPDLWREVATKGPARSDSTFIYSPFAGKARGETDPPLVCAAQHDALLVTVMLSNPFAFPLELAGLRLVSSGVAMEGEELALTLPAWTRAMPVSIVCVPRGVGQLSICTAEATIFGLPMTLTPAGGTISLPVIPSQPSLHLVNGPTGCSMALLEGERDELHLSVRNMSAIDVTSLKVVVADEFDSTLDVALTVDKILFGHDAKPVKPTKIPRGIKAGETAELAVRVIGVCGWTRSRLSICYHSEPVNGRTFQRSLGYAINGTVRPGMRVTQIAALPYRAVSPPDRHEHVVPDSGQLAADADAGAAEMPASDSFLPAPVDPKPKEDDYSLVIVDLENPTAHTFSLAVRAHGHQVGVSRVPQGATKRLVIPMRRLEIKYEDRCKGVVPSPAQLDLLHSLGKGEGDIDRVLYWTKRELLSALRLEWHCEPAMGGRLDVSGASIAKTFLPFLCQREVSISVDAHSSGRVGESLRVRIAVDAAEDATGYVLRALPALHISEDEFGIEYDDMLLVDGCLQAIHCAKIEHAFELVALAPCRVRLLVHVERRRDCSIHSHAHPVVIDFV